MKNLLFNLLLTTYSTPFFATSLGTNARNYFIDTGCYRTISGCPNGFLKNQPIDRQKRYIGIDDKNRTEKTITEEEASQLLNPFDILLAANKNIAAMLLQNIVDILQNFCTQIAQTHLLKASGTTLTYVQAEAVNPGINNFTSKFFSCAGSSQANISMSEAFNELYSNYECGPTGDQDSYICGKICLGTAMIAQQAFRQNVYLRMHYFSQYKTAVEFNRTASNFYQVHFKDPATGLALKFESDMIYTIDIPIINFIPAKYYACFVRARFEWSNVQCTSTRVKRTDSQKYYIRCRCNMPGTISVFIVNPPVPQPYPKFNEILLTFKLSSFPKCTQTQLSTFMFELSSTSEVYMRRFVSAQCTISAGTAEVQLVLRPPFRRTQMQNSYAVQAIQKIVSTNENTFLTFGNATVTSCTATAIHRDMKEDGNARKMCLHIDRIYQSVVGYDPVGTAKRWARSIASTVGISPYRIKNPVVAPGIVFNFTITVPFDDELSPISAEEISLIIKEDIQYGELSLEDSQGTILPVEPVQHNDIIELIPISDSNRMMLATAIVVSTAFVSTSVGVIFLVVHKIRTDRMIAGLRRSTTITATAWRFGNNRSYDGSASAPASSDGLKNQRMTIRHR